MNYDYIMVLVTASGIEEARKISQTILEKKKAACTNIISGVSSSFWWRGKIENADEVLLIMKTKTSQLDEIISLVKQNHSYEVPEIIAIPIVGGSADYLRWIDESVK
jgi:periplasmic divalent cation tolerance protein